MQPRLAEDGPELLLPRAAITGKSHHIPPHWTPEGLRVLIRETLHMVR